MLHTHFRLLVALTRTNGRSLVTCSRKSVIIPHTSTSTEHLKIYIHPYSRTGHICDFHCVLVTLQASSLAYTQATYAHVVHVTQRCLCLFVRISQRFLVAIVICGYRYSPVLALCTARTTDSLYSNTPPCCMLQLFIQTAGRVSHCTVPAWDRVRSDCCSGYDHGSLTVRSRSGKILFACI